MPFKLLIVGFVTALSREGYPGIFRAGRLWPGGKQVEVEVYDTLEDPPQEEGRPIMLGQKSLALLEEDPRISLKQERAKDALEAQVEIEKLVAEQEVLAEELEKVKAELLAHINAVASLKAENAKLKAENEGLKEAAAKAKK